MEAPPTPEDEMERLRVLQRYDVRETGPQETYDDLARLACYVTDAAVGMVSIIGRESTWMKATRNLDVSRVDREASFCAHLVESPDELMVIEDAREDPRFADNPHVVGEPSIRFYAGRPLTTPEDHVVGALCAFGPEPGTLDREQRELMDALGHQVMTNLVARRRLKELGDQIDQLGRV